MMHTEQGLYDSLVKVLADINAQIDVVVEDAKKRIELLPYPEGISVYNMQDRNGRPVLVDLLTAKATTIAAMATLKAASTKRTNRGAW